MRVVIDCEANGLKNPTQIWLIVCKDIDTNKLYIFRNVTSDQKALNAFLEFTRSVTTWIGHNLLGYDGPVLSHLCGFDIASKTNWGKHAEELGNYVEVLDTLVISKLVDYPRKGHSVEDYGREFELNKGKFSDWTKWSQEMEDYCIRDVDITHKIYLKYLKYLEDPKHKLSIEIEHRFQLVVNNLETNGFSFNTTKANKLLTDVSKQLQELDKEILNAFPDRLRAVREVHPVLTKHGTLSKKDFRFVPDGDLGEYNGGPFTRCIWSSFNPSSHRQIIGVLNDAGWTPIDRTQTHIDCEREINHLKHSRQEIPDLDIRLKEAHDKLQSLLKTGWKVNETNLSTLPENAPKPARTLAQRILLESRRRTLTEWLGLVDPVTNRIHGNYYGIGAWTHRMAHQRPNTANIPNEFKEDGTKKLLGKELRSLWQAPKNRLLVGVDAEGIQLRIFAHYIDDKEFTEALVNGRKSDKTDPHSLNQRILGPACLTRQSAKRFIYALLLGGGLDKLAAILGCSRTEAEEALARLLKRYEGFDYLKRKVIPSDAKRGWFEGLSGGAVRIPGDTVGERRHLCMSGYLQHGEQTVMKLATLKFEPKLKPMNALLVNLVHDEWQVECPNNMEVAVEIAKMLCSSLEEAGLDLKLKCPLAGSYWNDDKNDYTIGTNWSVTH